MRTQVAQCTALHKKTKQMEGGQYILKRQKRVWSKIDHTSYMNDWHQSSCHLMLTMDEHGHGMLQAPCSEIAWANSEHEVLQTRVR